MQSSRRCWKEKLLVSDCWFNSSSSSSSNTNSHHSLLLIIVVVTAETLNHSSTISLWSTRKQILNETQQPVPSVFEFPLPYSLPVLSVSTLCCSAPSPCVAFRTLVGEVAWILSNSSKANNVRSYFLFTFFRPLLDLLWDVHLAVIFSTRIFCLMLYSSEVLGKRLSL